MTHGRNTPEVSGLFSGRVEAQIVQDVLDGLSDGLIFLGTDKQALYATKKAELLLGRTLDALVSDCPYPALFKSDEEDEFQSIGESRAWERTIDGLVEFDYKHPDGRPRRLAVSTSFIMAQGDHALFSVGFVTSIRDVTELHRLRLKNIQLAKDRELVLRRKYLTLSKLAMGVEHEIRNPVVTIAGFATRIRKKSLNANHIADSSEKILQAARKLELVADAVNRFCSLPEARFDPTDVEKLVDQAVNRMANLVHAKGARVVTDHKTTRPSLPLLDGHLCLLALEELLENALEFSPRQSCVMIRTSSLPSGIVVEIEDQGCGIRPEDLDFVFDPFFSTRPDRPGMGLAIVMRIALEHHGTIAIQSLPGQGTTVRLEIPLETSESSTVSK